MSDSIQVVSTAVVVVGATVAAGQLRRAGSKARFDYLRELQKLRREMGPTYTDFLESFPILGSPADVTDLPSERLEQARVVSDAVNELAEMGEHNSVDRNLFYDFFHSHLIRVDFLLRPFLCSERARRGGRYGERLERVSEQARTFTALHYGNKPVYLPRDPLVLVYDPRDTRLGAKRGLWVRAKLQVRWRLRR